jgi:hypothetical protein
MRIVRGVDPMTRSPGTDPLSTLRRRTPWCGSVVAGLVALVILPGIVGCGDQPGVGSAGSGGVMSAAPPIGTFASESSDAASPAPSVVAGSRGASTAAESSDIASTTPALSDLPGQVAVAVGALARLVVRDAAPQMGYRRELFGQAWSDDVTVDDGHNGCDTRNDILRRDLTAVQIKAGTNGCVVLAGSLDDPYSAQTIAFVRGAATSDAVQIDHLVALSDAWRSGAQLLTADQRQNLANDPLNLLAVSGPLNEAKSDGDAASWLPPNVAFRCAYVIRQIQVKARYALWVVPAERDAMARILTTCSEAPVSESVPPVSSSPDDAPATVAPVGAPAVTGQTPGIVYFKNCAAARAAGAAPLYRGQPGYRDDMDGDQDGVACE